MDKGLLVVITGLPAAGKDTVTDILTKTRELNLQKIVTYATRKPRPGEQHGVDYHFVTNREFLKLKDENRLAEYVKAGTSIRGTPKKPFIDIIEKQKRYIWRNNPYRAANLNEFYTEVFGIKKGEMLSQQSTTFFLTASSKTLLQERWLERSRKDLISFEKRYYEDLEVFNKYRTKFDHIIENENRSVESVSDEIIKILKQYRL